VRIEQVVLKGHDETIVLNRLNDGIDVQPQKDPRKSFTITSDQLTNHPDKVDAAATDILTMLDAFETVEDRQVIVDTMESMGQTIN